MTDITPEFRCISPGRTIGAFTIVELLGWGGQAAVWKAHDIEFKRDVAIKLIEVPFADRLKSTKLIESLDREARLVAALKHQNIVTVFSPFHEIETDEVSGEQYLVIGFVMELLSHGTLASQDMLPKNAAERFPELLNIFRAVVHALEFAHAAGRAHGDIKPSNILLGVEGRLVPKLADFGIGRVLADAAGVPTIGRGTVEYMPPEQFTQPIECDADVYALGMTFFELFAGRLPLDFAACKVPDDFLAVHRDQAPLPLDRVLPDVPYGLTLLFLMMLSPSPRERPSITEVRRELRNIAAQIPRRRIVGQPDTFIREVVNDRRTAFFYHPDVHRLLGERCYLYFLRAPAWVSGEGNPLFRYVYELFGDRWTAFELYGDRELALIVWQPSSLHTEFSHGLAGYSPGPRHVAATHVRHLWANSRTKLISHRDAWRVKAFAATGAKEPAEGDRLKAEGLILGSLDVVKANPTAFTIVRWTRADPHLYSSRLETLTDRLRSLGKRHRISIFGAEASGEVVVWHSARALSEFKVVPHHIQSCFADSGSFTETYIETTAIRRVNEDPR